MGTKTLYEEFKDRLPPHLPEIAVNNMPRSIVENLAEEFENLNKNKTTSKEVESEEIEGLEDVDKFLDEYLEEDEFETNQTIEEMLEEAEDEELEPEVEEVSNSFTEFVKEAKQEAEPTPAKVVIKAKKEQPKPTTDLENLTILGINSMEAANSYNRYLKGIVRSTYMVTLPVSGYTAHLRGLKIDEVDSIKSSFEDNIRLKERLNELTYACIEKSTAEFKSYDEFLENTAAGELEILMFGMMIKTFGVINNYAYKCGNCGHQNTITINLNNVVRVNNDSALATIDDINSSENPKELYMNSNLRNSVRVQLPVSLLVLDLKLPSLKKEMSAMKFFKSTTNESSRLFILSSVIDKMFIPYFGNGDTPIGFTEVNAMGERAEYINTLTKEDRDVIESNLDEISKHRVDFRLSETKCGSCSHISEGANLDITENFMISILTEM